MKLLLLLTAVTGASYDDSYDEVVWRICPETGLEPLLANARQGGVTSCTNERCSFLRYTPSPRCNISVYRMRYIIGSIFPLSPARRQASRQFRFLQEKYQLNYGGKESFTSRLFPPILLLPVEFGLM